MKNIIGISVVILIIIVIQSCTKEDDNEIRDIDGNLYYSVIIGSQEWLVENLKTTRYNNGDVIGTTIPATLNIAAENSPKYQWAYDGLECAVASYGRLYTWYAATDIRGVCPIGWHVPDMGEWVTLYYPYDVSYDSIIGAELMETGTTYWNRSDITGTNQSGFTALPGGIRYNNGTFVGMNQSGVYWSSSEPGYAYNENALFYPIPITGSFGSSPLSLIRMKASGFSIRCIKDSI